MKAPSNRLDVGVGQSGSRAGFRLAPGRRQPLGHAPATSLLHCHQGVCSRRARRDREAGSAIAAAFASTSASKHSRRLRAPHSAPLARNTADSPKAAPLSDRSATPTNPPTPLGRRWSSISLGAHLAAPIGWRLHSPCSVEAPGASYGTGGRGKRRQSVFCSTHFSRTHWTRPSQLAHTRRPASKQFPLPLSHTPQVRGRYF